MTEKILNGATYEDELEPVRRLALLTVTNRAIALRQQLELAKREIERSLELMDYGLRPPGAYLNAFGPLGAQIPFDLAAHSQGLAQAIEIAQQLNISPKFLDQAMTGKES